ncbi:cysteine proteinase inhibitor 6-like isoform X2 [Tripterygium wilfordii]|uniref:cysteine proteinase inhibitor 6-like isoform X2 n=1 Tax=Tripterygium wilfordii TaxID=458696 RepID=UPI0018F82EF1|nr:cysteine proteinase inhibitor 6-like isoform X2 [Tripterygium wilfordii]
MKGVSVITLTSVLVLLCGVCELGFCREDKFIRMKPGGVHDCHGSQNSAEIESLARFAVQEFNKKENALLEFARVLKAKEQVVAGKMYHLTLEAMDAGKKKIYEAKVWVKPWINFKQLQEFKHAEGGPSFTTSDLGVKQGWQAVSTSDPEVQDAANHAVKSIQQRSNSLSPYQLLEIILAKAKVIEDYARYDLLLKLRRGIKEEKFKVEVIKNMEGKFVLV